MKNCLSSSGSLAFVVRAEYLIQTVEEFEDTNGVIRIHKSTNDRQHNDQKKKDKRINNDQQNITQKQKIE